MPLTFHPGDRVHCEYEGPATVVVDHGITDPTDSIRGVSWDMGVVITVDEDGAEVSAAHAQLSRLDESNVQ